MYQQTSDPIIPTVIAGVAIYVLGQMTQNFLLKPLQEFRIVLVTISHKIKFWSRFLTSPGINPELQKQAQADMRDLSSNLESRYINIPLKGILSFFAFIPPIDDVRIAAQKLIFLANSGINPAEGSKNGDAIEEIKTRLRLLL